LIPAPPLVEICLDSVESAVAAQLGGAGRVELCAGLAEGGTTPSAGLIAAVRTAISLPLHVLIRPRGGDFAYDPAELDVMLRDIAIARERGADGIVTGALTPQGAVDEAKMRTLIAAARPLRVAFHRAIDYASDPLAAVDAALRLGVDLVLSSGGAAGALAGADMLRSMRERAEGGRVDDGRELVVMAGGGINPDNVAQVVARSGVRAVHSRAARTVDGPMRVRRSGIRLGTAGPDADFTRTVADAGVVAALVAAVAGGA
jgi:copper homeostasis protein